MTREEKMKAICEIAGVNEIDDVSDGFHTFRQLYYQRMMLFATIVKCNKDKAWKSLRHEDGELCFGGGWFIVGIDTPEGSYTYHYEDNFYSLFDCVELERGKHWDGHTEKDVTRLLSLEQPSCEDCISRAEVRQLICKNNDKYGYSDRFHEFTQECLQLPSVTPTRPKGKWILIHPLQEDDDGAYICSNCEHGDWDCDTNYKYCPFCGADMREREEKNDIRRSNPPH